MTINLLNAAAASAPAASMDLTGMMDVFLIVAYIGCGLYGLFSWFLQRGSKAVLENRIICPNGCAPKRCRDPQAFLAFILPRVLILSLGLLVLGGVLVLDHFLGGWNAWLTIALMALPLALFFWYVHEQQKAVDRFWNGSRDPTVRRF